MGNFWTHFWTHFWSLSEHIRYILYMCVYGARDNAGSSFFEALKYALMNQIAC
jgi:hypothetical protein